MKLRTKSRLKGILIPAIAAFFLGAGVVACSSSGEENSPDAAMVEDGAVSNSDPLANDANATAEGGDANAAAGEGGNEELSNLVNDGSANAAAANPAADPGLTNNAGADPFANQSAEGAAAAETDPNATALNNGSGADPFANADGGAAGAADPALDPAVASETTATENPALAGAAPVENAPLSPENPAAALPVDPAVDAASLPATDAPADTTTESAPVAAPAAAGGYLPENGAKMAYYVQKGDTLGTIAQKIYGNKGKWRELAQANNLSDPNRIYAGDVVYYTLSDASRAFADKYETSGRMTVTVAAGDTLSSISAKIYGSQGSWRTLWKENPSVSNPDVIRPGMVLSYRSASATAFKEETEQTESEEVATATEQE